MVARVATACVTYLHACPVDRGKRAGLVSEGRRNGTRGLTMIVVRTQDYHEALDLVFGSLEGIELVRIEMKMVELDRTNIEEVRSNDGRRVR